MKILALKTFAPFMALLDEHQCIMFQVTGNPNYMTLNATVGYFKDEPYKPFTITIDAIAEISVNAYGNNIEFTIDNADPVCRNIKNGYAKQAQAIASIVHKAAYNIINMLLRSDTDTTIIVELTTSSYNFEILSLSVVGKNKVYSLEYRFTDQGICIETTRSQIMEMPAIL